MSYEPIFSCRFFHRWIVISLNTTNSCWRMMTMKGFILIAVLLAAVMAGAADQPKTIDSKAAFARLKQLAGEWQSAQAADGKTSHLSYRVIADGSAVEERFTGAPGEMLTVYT